MTRFTIVLKLLQRKWTFEDFRMQTYRYGASMLPRKLHVNVMILSMNVVNSM